MVRTPYLISDDLTFALDKERYLKELKELTRSNKTLNKPKKPLTPYMLFVREVSHLTYFLCKSINGLQIDKTESGKRQSRHSFLRYNEGGWSHLVEHL